MAQNLSLVAMLIVLLIIAYFYIVQEDYDAWDDIENASNSISTSETMNLATDTPYGKTLVVSGSAFASNNTDSSTLTIIVTLRTNSATTLDTTKTKVLSGPCGVGEVATWATSPLDSGATW